MAAQLEEPQLAASQTSGPRAVFSAPAAFSPMTACLRVTRTASLEMLRLENLDLA